MPSEKNDTVDWDIIVVCFVLIVGLYLGYCFGICK